MAKKFFTWAPGALAGYHPAPIAPGYYPNPKNPIDAVMVWAACMIDSTFGQFKLVLVEYWRGWTPLTPNKGEVTNYEDHWYTTNVPAGREYAALTVKAYSDAFDVYDLDEGHLDVIDANIVRNQPRQDYLSLTVTPKGRLPKPFTIDFTAVKGPDMQAQLRPSAVPEDQYVGIRACRDLANTTATGMKAVVPYMGHYTYLQSELYDLDGVLKPPQGWQDRPSKEPHGGWNRL
jgi:hypothetical protein